MPLVPLPRTESAVSACARQLREAILQGEFAAGTRLPPERDLAVQLGVNRVTVRNALMQLRTLHLLTARQGSGYKVNDFRREGGPDLIADLTGLAARSGGQALHAIIEDLLQVRRALARVLLQRLAERRCSAEAMQRILEKLNAFADAVTRNAPAPALAEADLALIAELVAATGSAVLQLCMNPLAGVLLRIPRLQEAMYREPAQNVLSYSLFVEWLQTEERQGDTLGWVLEALEVHDRQTLAAFGGER